MWLLMGAGEGSYLNDVNDAQVRFFRCEVLSLHEGQCHLIPLKNQNNVLPFRRFSNAKLCSVQVVLLGLGTPCQYLQEDVWSGGLCRQR